MEMFHSLHLHILITLHVYLQTWFSEIATFMRGQSGNLNIVHYMSEK